MNQILSFALPVLLFIANSLTGIVPRPQIISSVRGETYQPPAEIVALADASAMTDFARQIFYSTEPAIISDPATFQNECHSQPTDGTVELGCYTSDRRIYLFGISDPRLKPGLVMAAAHEMLHAAYGQLSSEDRAAISSSLEAESAGITDPDLHNRLAAYAVTEPGQNGNELHSILGTEYAPLSNELEVYYSRYFSDRNVIVSNARAFHDIFTQLSSRLAELNGQIHNSEAQIKTDQANGDVEAYNRDVEQLKTLIDAYNQVVGEYNALTVELTGAQQ